MEVRKQVEHLAQSYSNAINSHSEKDLHSILELLLPSLNFPIIITSNGEISASMNVFNSENLKEKEFWFIINEMDKEFEPLELSWDKIIWGKIHFSEPKVIRQLRWLKYIEIFFGIIFFITVFYGFHWVRNSEKNIIYVGMAKETAHQLGTPISSLMGWSKLIKDKRSHTPEIIKEIDNDINRLSEISKRFSKIGSKPKLKKINLNELILENINYFNLRFLNDSNIFIRCNIVGEIYIKGDWVLLSWVLENLIKNALDAIGQDSGEIIIEAFRNNQSISLNVIDNGKGIKRKIWKKIFSPGFSTKKRGWGIGLTLTKRIISEIHNGKIKVSKSKPGSTTINILFPNYS